MNTTRIKRGGAIAALLAGALAVAGCAGDATNADADGDSVLVYAVNGDPMQGGLNAQFVGGTYPILFSAQIFDPLIFQSDTFELTPGLAEDWELSDDGLDLTFTIRQGVTWHDGEPFTVEDVKFNFEEIVELQNYGAELAERIESVEIVDDSTVELHLSETYGPLLQNIAMQFMLPKHIYEGTDYITNNANKEPIGTGPMIYDSYTSGKEVVLVKNADYWGDVSQVDRAVYTVMGDANSRATALFAREIDGAVLDPSQQDRVSSDDNAVLMDHGQFPYMVTMMFNTESPELKDPAVRQAIFSALDRDAIVDTALAGIGTPANGFIPPGMDWAVNPDVDFAKDFPRDLDAINAVLDDAGFERGADGTRFTLHVLSIHTLTEVNATMEMAESMLAEVGIKLEIEGVGGTVYSDKLYAQSAFDLAFVRSATGPDPSLGISNWYVCNEERRTGHNPTGVCDPEVDAAAQAALSATEQSERAEAFYRMQERAAELMYYVPLAWTNNSFPTFNTARWDGLDGPRVLTERLPWSTLTPVE